MKEFRLPDSLGRTLVAGASVLSLLLAGVITPLYGFAVMTDCSTRQGSCTRTEQAYTVGLSTQVIVLLATFIVLWRTGVMRRRPGFCSVAIISLATITFLLTVLVTEYFIPPSV